MVGFFWILFVAAPIASLVVGGLLNRFGVPFWSVGFVPFPFLALFLFLWFLNLSTFRGRRYAITDRRVVVLDHRGDYAGELPRTEGLSAFVDGRDVVFVRGERALRFESPGDPEAALSALGDAS